MASLIHELIWDYGRKCNYLKTEEKIEVLVLARNFLYPIAYSSLHYLKEWPQNTSGYTGTDKIITLGIVLSIL